MDWVASLAFDEFSTTTDMNLSWEKATKYPQLEAEAWSNARDERNLDSDSLDLNSSIFFLTVLLCCCRCRKMCVCVYVTLLSYIFAIKLLLLDTSSNLNAAKQYTVIQINDFPYSRWHIVDVLHAICV